MEESYVDKLEGRFVSDLIIPMALLFQVIYLLLNAVFYVEDNVDTATAITSLGGGSGVIEESESITSVQALTTVSSIMLSATSSLWGSIIPSSELPPFRVDLFGVVLQFSMGGWNSWFLSGLIVLGCLHATYCLFVEVIHPSWKRYQKNRKKRKRGKRNWRRREKRFRRRKLHVNLVKRCRRRVGNRPPRLDGSRFRSPRTTKHRRWRRREARQRTHWEAANLAKELYEFCESPRPNPTHVETCFHPGWDKTVDRANQYRA